MRKITLRSLCLALLSLVLSSALPAQPLPSPDAAEIQLILKKLTVLGSVLYVAAHPDDENTAFLAYCSKGRLVRAAYLSTTRGEGGQNLIGPEQGDLLGVLRTQELLAARRIDGAEQFFTTAIDFGYSKSPGEALRIWNKREILADMVWVIRNLRPDVVVTRFTPTLGTHGHHTASAILANEAFEAAGDPRQFPEQLRQTRTWKPKRILFNHSSFFGIPFDTAAALKLDLGEYQPLLGRSFTELSGVSRSMHKSQGFGASQNRGPNVSYFMHTAGDSARSDLFDGIDLTWSRVTGGSSVGTILEEASASFRPENPSGVLPLLLKAYTGLSRLEGDSWIAVKKQELTEAIRLCAGIWVDALSLEPFVIPGSPVTVNVTALNRSPAAVRLERIVTSAANDTMLRLPLLNNVIVSVPLRCEVSAEAPLSQPYWLQERPETGHYHLPARTMLLRPENSPAMSADIILSINGTAVTLTVPVQYRWVDPVEGEMYRPLAVAPPVTVTLEEKNYLFDSDAARPVSVRLKSGAAGTRGTVSLRLPEGWTSLPDAASFELKSAGEEQTITFAVSPGGKGSGGAVSAVARVGAMEVDREMSVLRYPHIPVQTLFPRAEGKVIRIELAHGTKRVGYVMGSGDGVPAALRQIGYDVSLLSDEELAGGELSGFDVIIAGVRAANTRPKLIVYRERLMEFVKAGGTYLVQYVTPRGKESDNLGPYQMNISRDRVSVEDAPVTLLDAKDPLFTSPNAIGQVDFEGWVQERGLSFADRWDSAYRPALECGDPGEPSRRGGLLVASYGKGLFLYTGLSFFRQLPEGVPGAYRFFVNLVEARPGTPR